RRYRWRAPVLTHRCRVVVRADQRGLRPLDLTREVAQRLVVGADPDPVRGLADGAGLALQQFPLGFADHTRPEVAQLAQRGGVEGSGLGAIHPESFEPAA